MSAVEPVSARQNLADGAAIAMSVACLIHCLAIPILITMAPAWASWFDLPEALHIWLLVAVAPLSLLVLRKGAGRPLRLAAIGLSMMTGALFFEGNLLETVMTSMGAILLAAAHITNWLSRSHRHC